MKLLSTLSHKLLPVVLPPSPLQRVPVGDAISTVRGEVTALGPNDLAVYLPGAQIILRGEMASDKLKTTVTDENGRFSLADPPTDKCSGKASAEGFRAQTKVVRVPESSALELSFRLQLLTISERRDRI
jgi:Carboxypeptidase regulatory-like domain